MPAIDRNYLLGHLYDGRRVQEGRAQLPAEKSQAHRRLQAETRSYTLSLLIDAVNGGLLEQLHAEAQQALFIDVAVDQDRAWAAYKAGMGATPETTAAVAIPVVDGMRPIRREAYHSIDENAGVGPDLPDGMFDIADDYELLTMAELEDGA